jgi:ribosomal protein L3 glutamine methyltransferase
MTLIELIEQSAAQLKTAGVAFGQGTTNAFDEAAWLVLWRVGLPLRSALKGSKSVANRNISAVEYGHVAALIKARIETRKPAAYLTQEAWLQNVQFYVDERAIVPRSFIAELLVDAAIDPWLTDQTINVLDLCTGNGSLAVIAALAYPDIQVTASDLSADALAVAKINVEKHKLKSRITLLQSDGMSTPELRQRGPFDLILCNPPYVNAASMAALPPEYHAEPLIALDGNASGGQDGMDFIRMLLQDAPAQMSENAVLVLEIGNERENFEAAFPKMEVIWLECSAGGDQVLLVTRQALSAQAALRL